MASKDPVGAFFQDLFGDQKRSPVSSRSKSANSKEPSWIRPYVPLSAFAAGLAVLVWWAPNVLTTPNITDMYPGSITLAETLSEMRSRMIAVVMIAVVFDAVRVVRRRHRRVFAAVCAQTTGRTPQAIRLAPKTSRHSTPRAQISLDPGSVIDEKKLGYLRSAVTALYDGVPPETRARARAVAVVDIVVGGRLSSWTGGRSEAWATLGQWEYRVDYAAAKASISITRTLIAPDLRSERHIMIADLFSDGKTLKDAHVLVTDTGEDGDDVGFEISYKRTFASGDKANRSKLTGSLLEALGDHPSGQLWRVQWLKDRPAITVALRAPLPTMILHRAAVMASQLPVPALDDRGIGPQDLAWPLGEAALGAGASSGADGKSGALSLSKATALSGRRMHIPYATAEVDDELVVAYWNISSKSNAPHMLVVGPTGGGKTVLLTTLITELSLRGVASILVDPKRIELHQFLGYRGVAAVVFDALRAALLIEALYAEMITRTRYMQKHRIDGGEMPPLVVILDEFFILSAAWSHLKANGNDMEKEIIKRADPLGRIGQLVALARSTGIRLGLGVQRPDAQLFGKDAGGVRDNFQSRASLGRMSTDGNIMVWAIASAGDGVDTSIAGRGTVGVGGEPAVGQVWFTPSVDTHSAVRGKLSAEHLSAVESLLPDSDAPVYCFSDELAVYLADEHALVEVMGADVHEPIAVTAGTSRAEIEGRYALADSIADGVAVDSLEPGMSIVLELPGSAEPRVVDVLAVDVVRPVVRSGRESGYRVEDEGEVRVQVAAESGGSRRTVDVITYSGLDTVMLAAPELAPTPT
ncbi:FtsK/SpoIIIE domain-containing protein [Rhodococcus sp. 14-2483-1-2]|uniref:FtsK/SpoIIIE domain-containing protein n=1 Tax=Rhodococcus sp. 14-2483-1-2 TaxID=2023147 RepID=UPI0014826A52|nr:FtsK/SpoIIIE domain-containing protein [Rhodococcus sp. 14-2483-1-2]